jgi:hypothetical protein
MFLLIKRDCGWLTKEEWWKERRKEGRMKEKKEWKRGLKNEREKERGREWMRERMS